MNRIKVVVLGHRGMLGSMVSRVLYKDPSFLVHMFGHGFLDASSDGTDDIEKMIKGCKFVVNCIGIIKPHINENDSASVENAVQVNTLFPYALAEAAQRVNAKVIQIATDCVYSGVKGHHFETDEHDALDVYGKTKSLGEVRADNFYNLRCSIIGPERKNHLSLMDWFLSQPQGAEVDGFTNHLWGGISTYHFAKICQGIIKNNLTLPNVQHIVPSNSITKYGLLKTLAEEFYKDILINPVEAPMAIDRTLSTNYQGFNMDIWRTAGYKTPPTIEQMVKELKDIK